MALKPITLDATVTCVSTLDTAIDEERSQRAPSELLNGKLALVYGETRLTNPGQWREQIAVKDGERLTVFTIGVIPPTDLARIEDETKVGDKDSPRPREMFWRCFLAALRDVQDGPTASDGKVPKVKRDGREYVDPAWLAESFAGPLYTVAVEIGQNAYHWQQFTGGDANN